MIKLILKTSVWISIPLVFLGCAMTIPGGIEDSNTPLNPDSIQVIGPTEGKSSCTYLLGLQLGKPTIDDAVNQALAKNNGEALVNLSWYHKYTNYYLFQTYSFNVVGTSVRGGLPIKKAEIQTPITPVIRVREPFDHRFSIAFNFGSFKELNDDGDVKYKGLNGWTFSYRWHKPQKTYYFYPAFSFMTVGGTDESEESGSYYNGNSYLNKWDDNIRLRVFHFGGLCGINLSQLTADQPWIQSLNLPSELQFYLEPGIGLNISDEETQRDYYYAEHDSTGNLLYSWSGSADKWVNWRFTQIAYTFDLIVEYQYKPNLLLNASIGRNSSLMDFGLDTKATEEKLSFGFWRFSCGLTYHR